MGGVVTCCCCCFREKTGQFRVFDSFFFLACQCAVWVARFGCWRLLRCSSPCCEGDRKETERLATCVRRGKKESWQEQKENEAREGAGKQREHESKLCPGEAVASVAANRQQAIVTASRQRREKPREELRNAQPSYMTPAVVKSTAWLQIGSASVHAATVTTDVHPRRKSGCAQPKIEELVGPFT